MASGYMERAANNFTNRLKLSEKFSEDQNLWNFIGEVAADAERSGNFLLPEDLADNLVSGHRVLSSKIDAPSVTKNSREELFMTRPITPEAILKGGWN